MFLVNIYTCNDVTLQYVWLKAITLCILFNEALGNGTGFYHLIPATNEGGEAGGSVRIIFISYKKRGKNENPL